MLKKILFSLLALILIFLVANFSAISYGIQQGIGQAEVLWNAKDIRELMLDDKLSDSVKQQFLYIEEVKRYAEESLGLKPTENYSTFYDQKGEPILWVVTASPEFKIEAKEWCFPIAGCFPYKGSFDLEKAKKEEAIWKAKGFDTEVGEVNAWSTLGWFKDPILSSMLNRSKGSLAELIIHESTHATLYVKDSVQFNENLASFIGKKGAELFLKDHFGPSSVELMDYKKGQAKGKIFKNYMRSAIEKMDSLYASFPKNISIKEKRALKSEGIKQLKEALLRTEYYENDSLGRERLKGFKPNNAYFSGFSTYSKELPQLDNQLKTEFKENLKLMIDSFEKKYESL